MKNQALFSAKDKSKKLKYHLLQFLFGALRVKIFSEEASLLTVQYIDLLYMLLRISLLRFMLICFIYGRSAVIYTATSKCFHRSLC